ncbi:MAG: TetR/AcrR family transcriptional regulator [Chloroflexi bacterium]|nr:TetR/AcrR family transcriptional regulator [Chloroflexota bacterium]
MSPRIYKPSQQTRARILQKAVELFNESGTTSVSMNALAESLEISAGNLQYHYKSRDEIIRAILEEMFVEFDAIYVFAEEEPFTLDTLRRIMRVNFDLVWKHRFFYREFAALLRSDPILARRFREIQEKRLTDQENVFKRVAGSGGVRSVLSPEELRNVVLIGWVLVHSWLSYAESTGQKIDNAALEHAVEIMVQHYKPYLQEIQ